MPECITGAGATLVLTDSGALGRVLTVSGWNPTRTVLDTTPLARAAGAATSWRRKKVGDLWEPGQISATFLFDPELTNYPLIDVDDDLTLAYNNSGTARRLVGSGFVVDFNSGDLEIDQLAIGSLTWQFDGDQTLANAVTSVTYPKFENDV